MDFVKPDHLGACFVNADIAVLLGPHYFLRLASSFFFEEWSKPRLFLTFATCPLGRLPAGLVLRHSPLAFRFPLAKLPGNGLHGIADSVIDGRQNDAAQTENDACGEHGTDHDGE
jgi:hypothetical protein